MYCGAEVPKELNLSRAEAQTLIKEKHERVQAEQADEHIWGHPRKNTKKNGRPRPSDGSTGFWAAMLALFTMGNN